MELAKEEKMVAFASATKVVRKHPGEGCVCFYKHGFMKVRCADGGLWVWGG